MSNLYEPAFVFSAGDAEALAVNRDMRVLDMDNKRGTIQLSGLHRADFAVFGTYLSDDGATETGHLVTAYSRRGVATLTESDLVEANPNKLASRYLRKLLRQIGPEELAQFSVDTLVKHVFADSTPRIR